MAGSKHTPTTPTSTDARLRLAEREAQAADRDRELARAGDQDAAARLVARKIVEDLSAYEAAALVDAMLAGGPGSEQYGDPACELIRRETRSQDQWDLARVELMRIARARVAAELPAEVALLVLGRKTYLAETGLDRVPKGATRWKPDDVLREQLHEAWRALLSPEMEAKRQRDLRRKRQARLVAVMVEEMKRIQEAPAPSYSTEEVVEWALPRFKPGHMLYAIIGATGAIQAFGLSGGFPADWQSQGYSCLGDARRLLEGKGALLRVAEAVQRTVEGRRA